MNMSLESLLEDLEKQAGFTKQASDESDKKKEEEKKNEEKEKGSKDGDDESKSKLEKAKEELNKAEKDLDSAGQTKEAQDAGASFAQAIMQKVASVQLSTKENKETEMNKQASIAGKALADALMEKLASAGDLTTTNGIPDGVVPNKNQIDTAQLVAEQDATIKPMPTGDGIKNTGTINQIFDAIVADAMGQGAASFDQVHSTGVSQAEGAVEGHAVPNQVQADNVEKTAAVMSLVNSGIDFDSAVDMVKSAAEELEFEEGEQIKQAAFADLIDQGVDFELAAALIKSASAVGPSIGVARRGARAVGEAVGNLGLGAKVEAARSAVQGAAGTASSAVQGAAGTAKDWLQAEAANAGRNFRGLATGKNPLGAPGAYSRMDAAKHLAHNRLVQGGAAAGVLGAGGAAYALGREKKAAVDSLVEAGVDFESAVDLVQAKSQELYGA